MSLHLAKHATTNTSSTVPPVTGADDHAVSVDKLFIGYGDKRSDQIRPVVRDVSFKIRRGETLALVGQSGSGKSTIALAVAGLLPGNGRVASGSIRLGGHDVAAYTRAQWRPLRGKVLGFVPQDALSSLDPLQRIGDQIVQSLLIHRVVERGQAKRRAIELLDRVGIQSAASRYSAYPHELSGGQLQRVLIAIAIAADPAVLVADEPTSALDVSVQKTILDLIEDLQRERGLSVLFITHDLALAKARSHQILVLNHGETREYGRVDQVLSAPKDPYTIKLLSDAPALSPHKFAEIKHTRAAPLDAKAIRIDKLSKIYPAANGIAAPAPALDNVSFTVTRGTIHALVGESGSGKTTVARIVAGLLGFTAGSVSVGNRILPLEPPLSNAHPRQLQQVYQNPLAAMDPKFTVRDIIEEPLRIHRIGDAAQRLAAVKAVLDQVALSSQILDRKPRELSGGQRQRVAVARALVLTPEILVLDEPTSALDVTVQAQLIELLVDLQIRNRLTYLFISHDLSLVRQIADEVSVLSKGRLVETGKPGQIFNAPAHAYTRKLVDSIPGWRPLEAVA